MMPAVILFLALLHASAATADGFSTKYWERACPACREAQPDRAFIGARPTWPRMAGWGAAEVGAGAVAGALLYRWRPTRKISWLPQMFFVSWHAHDTAHNYASRFPHGR